HEGGRLQGFRRLLSPARDLSPRLLRLLVLPPRRGTRGPAHGQAHGLDSWGDWGKLIPAGRASDERNARSPLHGPAQEGNPAGDTGRPTLGFGKKLRLSPPQGPGPRHGTARGARRSQS